MWVALRWRMLAMAASTRPQIVPGIGHATSRMPRPARPEHRQIHEEDREKRVFLLWMTDFFRKQLERTAGILGITIPAYM